VQPLALLLLLLGLHCRQALALLLLLTPEPRSLFQLLLVRCALLLLLLKSPLRLLPLQCTTSSCRKESSGDLSHDMCCCRTQIKWVCTQLLTVVVLTCCTTLLAAMPGSQ
jgi:hypothetical protein